jgi:magnesium-transporting ATPase (P-type)
VSPKDNKEETSQGDTAFLFLRRPLRSIGVLSNPLLLWGIGFELILAAAIIYLPPMQTVLGTAPLSLDMLVFTLPFPIIVWGADELRRWLLRRKDKHATTDEA